MKIIKYSINATPYLLVEKPLMTHASKIQEILDFKRGFGGQGLLFLIQNSSGWLLKMMNPDGTEALICYNGLRCAGAYVMEKENSSECHIMMNERTYLLKKEARGITLECDVPEYVENLFYRIGDIHKLELAGILDTKQNLCAQHQIRYLDSGSFMIDSYDSHAGILNDSAEGIAAAFYHGYQNKKLKREAMAISKGGRTFISYNLRSLSLCAKTEKIFEAEDLKNSEDSGIIKNKR